MQYFVWFYSLFNRDVVVLFKVSSGFQKYKAYSYGSSLRIHHLALKGTLAVSAFLHCAQPKQRVHKSATFIRAVLNTLMI